MHLSSLEEANNGISEQHALFYLSETYLLFEHCAFGSGSRLLLGLSLVTHGMTAGLCPTQLPLPRGA